jgi:hypothetical protein
MPIMTMISVIIVAMSSGVMRLTMTMIAADSVPIMPTAVVLGHVATITAM